MDCFVLEFVNRIAVVLEPLTVCGSMNPQQVEKRPVGVSVPERHGKVWGNQA